MCQQGCPWGKGTVYISVGSIVSKDTVWTFPTTAAGCQNSSYLTVEAGRLFFCNKVIAYQNSPVAESKNPLPVSNLRILVKL